MTERNTAHGPGPDIKGGGFRGGPKRWTGRGPAPARHIPWPEIFKHHISLVEGHLKMIDMVRKHTVEGSGNYRTIMGCVDRTKEMLQVSKQVSRTFVEPPNLREQVPLGSSSASMYPGYSPADHEYGKAAEEYGKAAAEARARGIEFKHPDVEYEVGQAKGVKRKTLAEIRESQAAKGRTSGSGNGSGTGSGSEVSIKQTPTKEPPTTNGQASTEKAEEASPDGDNPYFVIDTKPTPINVPGMSSQPLKRSASPPEAVEAKKHKKAKKKHDGAMPKGEDTQEVKTEDISERVEARMKEKEKKRKMKEEKKRKRQSEGEPAAEETQPITEPSAVAAEVEMPKKKKKKGKKAEEEPLPDRSVSKKRRGEGEGEGEGEAEDGEGKKKKKRKKNKEAATASDV